MLDSQVRGVSARGSIVAFGGLLALLSCLHGPAQANDQHGGAVATPVAQLSADPVPGTTISATNAEKFRRYTPAALMFALRHGFQANVAPTERFAWPSRFKEATEMYSSQVSLGGDGFISGYVAGMPFVLVDLSDPQAAIKIAYNWHHGPFMPDDYALTPPSKLLAYEFDRAGPEGRQLEDYDYLREGSCNQLRFLRYANRTEVDPRPSLPSNPQKVEWKGRGDGCGVDHQWKAVWLRFLDPNRADEGYFYSAEFQHAWRTVARDGYPLAYGKSYGESCTYSCVEGWWDFSIPPKTESYSYRLIGDQPILAAMDATAGGVGIANGRLTSATFQIRRAYVIEMKPRDPHSPALNAIVFIDTETYLWLAAEFSFSDGPQAVAMPLWGHLVNAGGDTLFLLENDFYVAADRPNLLLTLNLPAGAQSVNKGEMSEQLFSPANLH